MAFTLEYALGNCGKLRVTLVGTGDDTGSVVELGDSGVIGLDDSGFCHHGLRHEESQGV